VALLGRAIETQECYDQFSDPHILSLCERIDLEMRPDDADNVELEARLADGRTLLASAVEMDMLRPTTEKVIAKFRRNTAGLASVDAERILEAVMQIEKIGDIGELTGLLRRAASPAQERARDRR